MQNEQRSQYLNRGRILSLLSDDEIAQVSRADHAVCLSEGEEYLDLGDLEHGVRRAHGAAMSMRRVLPRKAVHPGTWSDILAQLVRQDAAKPDGVMNGASCSPHEYDVAASSEDLTRPREAKEALEQFFHAADERHVGISYR